jgi:hypothetical protein
MKKDKPSERIRLENYDNSYSKEKSGKRKEGKKGRVKSKFDRLPRS